MSIIWIDDILFQEVNGKREIRDTSIFVYANLLSVLFTIIYAYFYKAHPQLHKPPNNLTMLKILLQGLISFHLLILFAAVNVEDNIKDYDTVNFFVKLTVTFSPVLVFSCYYIHACLAHNIYNTYYDYRKSYEKRILFYHYSLIFLSVIIYLLTIFDLVNNKGFSFILYKPKFILIFYLAGLLIILYIIHRLYFINMKQRSQLITLNNDDPRDTLLRNSATKLVKRYLIVLIIFSLSYMPNNIFMIIKFGMLEGYLSNYYLTFISTMMISLNAFAACVIKFTDPYLRKIIQSYFKQSESSCEKEFGETNGYNSNDNNSSEEITKVVSNSNVEMDNINNNPTQSAIGSNLPHSDPIPKNNTHLPHVCHLNLNLKMNTTKNDFQRGLDLHSLKVDSIHKDLRKQSEDIRSVMSINSDNVAEAHHLTIGRLPINRILGPPNNNINSAYSLSQFSRDRRRTTKNSFFFSNEGDRTFDLINFHLEYTDNIYRMIGISISINQDRIYDKDKLFKNKFDSILPWSEDKYYNEKTKPNEFTQENLPDWVSIKYDKRFKLLHLKVKKYAPLVFHHIRVIDKISIDDCIKSLDPILNLEKINELKVSGGNSSNSILYTWDRKMLVKTISKQEKILLMKEVLKNYHVRMRDTKSLLCRIYGLFRIGVSDQGDTYVLIMKNMCDLHLETRVLMFDLKGSSVNRECILDKDKKKYQKKDELMTVYKNKILKDNDLRFLDIKFNLSDSDATNLITAVEKDSQFLEKYWITDYSMLVAIHRFHVEDYRSNFRNLRVLKSHDDKYLFSFSIIDFLTTYDLEKKGEKITKNIASIVKMTKDKNFSVQDPKRYGTRFRNFIKSLIQSEEN